MSVLYSKTFRKNFTTENEKERDDEDVQVLLDLKSPSIALRYFANVRADELKNKINKLQ